jgi:SET domain-containing protein
MLSVRTYVDRSTIPEAGAGCFAAEFIEKGTQVYQYKENFDLIFDKDYYNDVVDEMDPVIRDFIYMYTFYDSTRDSYILEVDNGRFANHSCNPNINAEGIAIRDIQEGEEILYDYKDFLLPEDYKPYML